MRLWTQQQVGRVASKCREAGLLASRNDNKWKICNVGSKSRCFFAGVRALDVLLRFPTVRQGLPNEPAVPAVLFQSVCRLPSWLGCLFGEDCKSSLPATSANDVPRPMPPTKLGTNLAVAEADHSLRQKMTLTKTKFKLLQIRDN